MRTEKEIREMLEIIDMFIVPSEHSCECKECKRRSGFISALNWVLSEKESDPR